MSTTGAIRDRIKELRRVRAGELHPHPSNFRRHPPAQRGALQAALREVGWADALVARELPGGGLQILDGHLRADLDPEQTVPVLVLDVTEEEGDKILATLDPLAAMAEADNKTLGDLLAGIKADDPAFASLMHTLEKEHGIQRETVEDPGPRIDEAEELRKKWGVERGQLWVAGTVYVCERCGEVHEVP